MINERFDMIESDSALHYEGDELNALEQAKNYYDWLVHEFGPALNGKILEVGAGTGTLSEILLTRPCERLICLEPARNLIPALRRRLQDSVSHDSTVDIVANTFEGYCRDAGDKTVDSIVCINVLEHILNDLSTLQEMRRLLQPGGKLCLFVPALPFIYGTLDEMFGHYRRYTKQGLRSLAHQAGFKINKLKYLNLPGSFAWLLMGRVLRWKTWDEAPVRWYDQLVIPGVRFVESIIAPPFGQSLLLIAEA
jgi:SAM-dependent methyltransferase